MEKVLESLITKLQAHHEEVMKNEVNYKALESPIQGPDRSRLTNFVEMNHCSMLIQLFRAVIDAQRLSSGEGGTDPENSLSEASKLFGQMTDQVIKSSCHSLKNREDFLEKLVSVIEVSSKNHIFKSSGSGSNFDLMVPKLSKVHRVAQVINIFKKFKWFLLEL